MEMDGLTSSMIAVNIPPATPPPINVVRASAMSSKVLAIVRNASLTASGSSLKVEEKFNIEERFAAEARYREPDWSLPSVFRANRAWAASGE